MWQSIASDARATGATKELHRAATQIAKIVAFHERSGPGLQIVMFSLSRPAWLDHRDTSTAARLTIYPHPVLDQFKAGAGAWTAIFSGCVLRRFIEPTAIMNDQRSIRDGLVNAATVQWSH